MKFKVHSSGTTPKRSVKTAKVRSIGQLVKQVGMFGGTETSSVRPRKQSGAAGLGVGGVWTLGGASRPPLDDVYLRNFALNATLPLKPQGGHGNGPGPGGASEGVFRRRPWQNLRAIRNASNHLNEYCQSSTLHGLRYVGDRTLSIIERVFWAVSFLLAVAVAGYFIGNVYEKWNISPVIITLSPKYTELKEIPFPAITICNMNQVKRTEAQAILEHGTDVEKNLLEDFCQAGDSMGNMTDARGNDVTADWDTVRKFMIKVGQSCSQMTWLCLWNNEEKICDDYFNSALTDEGICCSFNKVHRKLLFRNPDDLGDLNVTFPLSSYLDWTPESGYPHGAPRSANPLRARGAGTHLGLTLILDTQTDDYYCSSTVSVGFKIVLHSPVETPRIADFGFLVAPGREARIVIIPKINDATPQIRDIQIDKRQCFFSNERTLTFFRTYTQRNCNMECLANATLNDCQCVPYHMPKNKHTRICGRSKDKCIKDIKAKMETHRDVNNVSTNGTKTSCNCLPGCYEIQYGKDQSSALLADSFTIRPQYLRDAPPDYFKRNMAVIHFYFLSNEFTSNTKGELFGLTEFLSNTGGLLGLFMGFSFLSVVEIGYFFTLRAIMFYYRNRKSEAHTVNSKNVIYPFAK